MIQTLADTLHVLTTCYAAAMGVTPMWTVETALVDTTPQVLATIETRDEPTLYARITYNRLALADSSDQFRRATVVHYLEHVYWEAVHQAAMWAAQQAAAQYGNPEIIGHMRQLLENLTVHRSRLPMWQRICGQTGPPRMQKANENTDKTVP